MDERVRVTPNVWSNGRAQRKNRLKEEDHIFLSNGRVQMKETYQ